MSLQKYFLYFHNILMSFYKVQIIKIHFSHFRFIISFAIARQLRLYQCAVY